MRKYEWIILILLTMFVGCEQALSANLEPNCVGWWKCNDDTNNTIVIDSSKYGNDGNSSVNTDAIGTAGKISKGFSFDGNSQYLNLGHETIYGMVGGHSVSYCFWFFVSTDACNIQQPLLEQSSDPNIEECTDGFTLFYNTNDGKMYYYSFSESFTPLITGITSKGQWHFISLIITYTGVPSRNIQLFVDNNLADEDVLGVSAAMPGTDLLIGKTNLNIGQGTPPFYLKGKIDNLMIFNKALSSSDINWLWNNGRGTENLKSYVAIGGL